jgi:hypothetical protein
MRNRPRARFVEAAQQIHRDRLHELPLDAAFVSIASAQPLKDPHLVLR